MQPPAEAGEVAAAVARLAIPVFLTGMARGLLGVAHPLQMRHRRKEALRESDLVILAGVACDFRLDYGRHIARAARLVAVNRSRGELARNRRPTLGVAADPGRFLCNLAAVAPADREGWRPWRDALRRRDGEREEEIRVRSAAPTVGLNPLAVCRAVEQVLPEASVLVADGGDFVATASYIVAPRGPLAWLDPGTFGTLGVGAGFALGARLCRPEAEVWILYGDGAAAYSLAELDTFARHGLSVIALVGNDAGWTQIAREQVAILGDDVGTVLAASDYHAVAEGFGAVGLEARSGDDLTAVLRRAQAEARAGRAVLVNALLGKTDFRKGSLSI
jgi:acetolactate synthase-1/2/3 large subunit